MIELTQDQERQARLPDQQTMVQESLQFIRTKLPDIYHKHGHQEVSSRLMQGYNAAMKVGLSERDLIKKYMMYGVSAPALRDAPRMEQHFSSDDTNPDMLARDVFALLELRPVQ